MRPHSYAFVSLLTASLCVSVGRAEDPGWPRRVTAPQGTLITYQPQVDDWQNFRDLNFRMALSIKPTGGKEALGVAVLSAQTVVDPATDMVQINNITIKSLNFPSLDPVAAANDDALVRTFVPNTISMSLRRIVACTPKKEAPPVVAVDNTPPPIFVSYNPAIMLFVDGSPRLTTIPNTSLEYVTNTQWPLFLDESRSQFYLLVGQHWLTASAIQGPWAPTSTLPANMNVVTAEPQWASLRTVVPAVPNPSGPIPAVFYSSVPAEVILFNGNPNFSKIPGVQLKYATNTDSNVFRYATTQQYYYLTAGRWFSSNSLQGPWVYATPNLPADFAMIPPANPAGRVLAWVPGTEEAKDAVLLAQVPTVLNVSPSAAAQVNVTYSGPPDFKPIEGTSLTYAANTPDKVIDVNNTYYLCLQGVWFFSATPQGPWTTASSVPPAIYTIPPSSPVYNVTYVTQTATADGNVQASHTAGYLGAFIAGAATGAIVASGSGYYYPPYYGAAAYGAAYTPYPHTYGATPYYNDHTGAYGLSQTAYGPDGGSASRSASYNPYTGTAARTASVSTPYGSHSAGEAYNPYTGTYAKTAQGSSPGKQWGSSEVSRGDQSAYAEHETTSKGTAAAAEDSRGGAVAGTSTAYGNAAVGKTANGDMYAGKDGNVYKNTGSGWQKYGSNGWNKASSTSSDADRMQSADRASDASHSGSSGLSHDFDDRRRGDDSSRHFGGGGGRRR